MLDTELYLALNGLVGHSVSLDATILFAADTLAYVLGAAFLVRVLFFHVPKWQTGEFLGVSLLSAFIARFGVTEAIRLFVHRPRPFLELPTHPLLQSSSWSFPSGHATFFFGLSTAVYLYDREWGIAFFAASTLMAFARVAAGVHYVSDIVAGALIGVLVALVVFKYYPKTAPKKH